MLINLFHLFIYLIIYLFFIHFFLHTSSSVGKYSGGGL